MKQSIAERLEGRIDHGFYGTIEAVAKALGLSYRQAQRALLEEHRAGQLSREWAGRRLVYTSRQLALFDGVRRERRQRATRPQRGVRAAAINTNQGGLFEDSHPQA
jgi:hypothetical protein